MVGYWFYPHTISKGSDKQDLPLRYEQTIELQWAQYTHTQLSTSKQPPRSPKNNIITTTFWLVGCLFCLRSIPQRTYALTDGASPLLRKHRCGLLDFPDSPTASGVNLLDPFGKGISRVAWVIGITMREILTRWTDDWKFVSGQYKPPEPVLSQGESVGP